MKANFGWTVVYNVGKGTFFVYKRDCPADKAHFASDLAQFTHPTKSAAISAGKRGEYAYKR